MVMFNKTVTIIGECKMNDGEKDVQVAYMTANISTDGKININRAIQDKAVFEANREEVLKDFAAFDDYVYNCELPNAETAESGGNDQPGK